MAPLDLSATLAVGDDAVVDGYPFGGPFTTGPAEVLAVSTEQIADIYGTGTSPREVYSLAARVNPGNSGGPLLTTGGDVAGVVFARSASDDDLGYAMTNAELAPVVAQAPAWRPRSSPAPACAASLRSASRGSGCRMYHSVYERGPAVVGEPDHPEVRVPAPLGVDRVALDEREIAVDARPATR